MSELITETILPGTYIEVRAEGLLSVGAIATGNVGVVGTSERGDASLARLTSYDDARARFGEPGTWDPGAGEDNHALVRSLRLLFENGAQTVYATRVLDSEGAAPATFTLGSEAGGTLRIRARTPGTWGNRLELRVDDAEDKDLVGDEVLSRIDGGYVLSASSVLVPPAPAAEAAPAAPAAPAAAPVGPSVGSVTVREGGVSRRYQLRTTAAASETVQVVPATRRLVFPAQPAETAQVRASYWVPAESLRRVTLRIGAQQEVFVVPSLRVLYQRLADPERPSRLVEAVGAPAGDGMPQRSEAGRFAAFAGGSDGAPNASHMQEALDRLVDQDVQLVLVAGASFRRVRSALLGHVERTENLGRERIAVVGADRSDVDRILENANEVADKRVVLVAPGLRQTDPVTGRVSTLPPAYAAAAVAGRLSALPPHVSLTNKTLAGIDALDVAYNDGELKALVTNRVLALHTRRGTRVVKGITTDDAAFRQISVRRIVDYVKQGTRIGANQYIGRLNNRRVRENLRSTLDGFLADLVRREFLTGYRLTVMADRPMEIRGEVLVTMDLNPTFSIDVVRVVMNLN